MKSQDVPWRLFRRLQNKKEREARNLTVAEGPEVVLSALSSTLDIDSVVFSEDFFRNKDHEDLEKALAKKGSLKRYEVQRDLFERMSGTKNPSGILAVLPFPFVASKTSCPSFSVACVDVQDPGNVGTIIRASAAADVDKILILGNSADPFSPKTIRASAGAVFHVPLSSEKAKEEPLRRLQKAGVTLIKAHPRGGVFPWDVDFTRPFCIVVGNEARGLDEVVERIPGVEVTVPMSGKTESLNAAMASGMLIYEALRQRIQAKNPPFCP